MSAANTESQIPAANRSIDDQSLKLAVAISLLRSKAIQKQQPQPIASDPSISDALRWKQKAKERKQELLRLREDLKQAEDTSNGDLFSQNASCKCYFFDNLVKSNSARVEDGTDNRFNDVLRRRFLRRVRYKERRRKADSSIQRKRLLEFNEDDEVEHLRVSVDFLVELCDTFSSAGETNFKNWAHQAVDFILASLKDLLPAGRDPDLIEGIVCSLIMRLIRRMCSPTKDESLDFDSDVCFHVQHLIRELAREPYIGQRAILSVSQRISTAGESMLFMDPFDGNFPSVNEYLFIMIQLIEFLISDYLQIWSANENFDDLLFEEWVISIIHAKKALELLESRNGLYVLYMDRVTGELAKHLNHLTRLPKLKPEILGDLIH